MEISSKWGGYLANYPNKHTNNTNIDGIKTSVVELKTSKGITKTEEIKTGFSNTNDYSKYLQRKYKYMNAGISSMSGIPTNVSVSGVFLTKCMNDPQKAKYLEENLAAIPDCAEYARTHSLGTLTSLSYSFDDNGNIAIISSGTNDPDGKIARENAKRRIKEQKQAQEIEKKKLEEKIAQNIRAKKKQLQEDIEKARNINLTYTGNSVKDITQTLVSAISLNLEVTALDIKA